ncbi:MAG: 2-oxoacid:acceptor oxidoreductase subunit alpha, partial [Anaerolineae bacterium]|nr:2-oxoacid:acceptor oxidoreductase subunit alpha [Anaerolineae bacterium]
RGTGHNDMATYSERGDDWLENLNRITQKIGSSRALLPQPIIDFDAQNEIGIISFGSNDSAVEEGRDRLAAEGIGTNYLRVRALPLAASVKEFIFKHKHVYVVENNHDGQLAQLIRMETAEDTTHMISLPLGDTLPMTAKWIFESVTQWENK